MAAIGGTNLTLLDIAKLRGPNDQISRIIELLSQTNEMLEDMPFKEANEKSGHLTTVQAGLPDVYFRLYNQGTLTSKATTDQIRETFAMLDAWSQIDQKLAEHGGDKDAVIASQHRPFIESMSQRMARTVWYGSPTQPEEFIGMSNRYADLSAGNAENIIDAEGASSTNASIWLISWDDETVHGIYPQGSTAGLSHQDMGLVTSENFGGVSGALLNVYRHHWMWDAGLALVDWRYAVRIANIDVPDLATSDAADLIYLMEEAEERIQSGLGKRAFYMNRTLRRYLRHQSKAAVKAGGGLTWETVGGKRVGFFGDTPVRLSDALVNTEEAVVAS